MPSSSPPRGGANHRTDRVRGGEDSVRPRRVKAKRSPRKTRKTRNRRRTMCVFYFVFFVSFVVTLFFLPCPSEVGEYSLHRPCRFRRPAVTRRTWIAALLTLGSLPMTAPADEGMWLLNEPPRDHLKAKYGFELTDAWLRRAQKASVRFNNGG